MNAKTPQPDTNMTEFSVSELSQALKRTVEDSFSYVRVRGEISGFKRAASGHLYMTMKDDSAVLDAVCWRGVAGRLAIKPEDGMEVVATGKLTTYPGRSKYQIVIDSLELAGEGALLKLLEDRRKKLAAEGLFDEARKKPLPYLPSVIGIVTSPTGAVIRDILHRLADRFPSHVLLAPVLVQGENAAAQIAEAIVNFNAMEADGDIQRPDLLIVARGGGSLEDLWAFNEEVVVRAAAASAIPLISAVGHETDTTLIDFASDRRAPTPTAAAELAVPVRSDLLGHLADKSRRSIGAMARVLEDRRVRVEGLSRGLPDLNSLLGMRMQRFDGIEERFGKALGAFVEQKSHRVDLLAARLRQPEQIIRDKHIQMDTLAKSLQVHLRQAQNLAAERLLSISNRLQPGTVQKRTDDRQRDLAKLWPRAIAAANRNIADAEAGTKQLTQLLESYSYNSVLKRGFALVTDANGNVVTQAAKTKVGQEIDLQFSDGDVSALVSGKKQPMRTENKKPAVKEKRKDNRQRSLL